MGISKHLEKMPEADILVTAALVLNSYVIFTQTNYSSYKELLEPAATSQIMILQLSAIMAIVYLAEYKGDSEEESSTYHSSSSGGEGWTEFFSDLAENSIVEAATVVVLFLGYQSVQSQAGYGTSLTEVKMEPTSIAMQLTALAIINMGVQVISHFLSDE